MTTDLCPYPGLRPFTEHESIFFKGRDLHIRQIIKLLEENKMAFITGASGDGKSSMVYAGVVPNIRAGFCKSTFNSWIVVDFKPQKNPLYSLSESFSENLNCDNQKTLNELKLGFSSLVDLYKNSGYFVNQGENISNRGKNLLIIADQFEEIITNSENFNNGIPSEESYTTINLLLETIRISIIEKLPIYVIFTMRSDFISQCTVFKNLPEYIAYSQFFVPQLKRTEIRQVIEQPAILAGGSVSSRLTEIIINNLNSSFDQLPVLQHALNLLWKMADNGKKQLDLIHLAKIAGISTDVLSNEELDDFNQWFCQLPDYQYKYFENPSINNVLNAHAGILYESAYNYFLENAVWAEKSINPDESKEIIETVFKSLTKVDNNRQVRNRCSINEITGIINKDNITNATVCGVINIFRTPENSLIQPFIDPNRIDTQYLSGDTILDVTHEALLRNWQRLTVWQEEEVTFLKDYHDFSTQMNRWLNSDCNPKYLLSSGIYTYFNNWYIISKPNQYRFLKYDNSQSSARKKLRDAQTQYENCQDFLEISEEAIQTQERSKRRKITIAMFSLTAFVIALIIVSSWALSEKQNAEEKSIYAQQQADSANRQKLIAENSQRMAERANNDAKFQRDTARILALQAQKAQKESERARRLAEHRRDEADSLRELAMNNLGNAEFERMVANDAREIAEQQKLLAQSAHDSVSKYYKIAISNTLAMKAKGQYGDKKMNLRMVYTAYLYNKNNNISHNDAELFEAMLYTFDNNNLFKPLKVTNEPISSFYIDLNNNLWIFTENAQIIEYNNISKRIHEIQRINQFISKEIVKKSIFISSKYLVYTNTENSSYFIDIDKQEKTKLDIQGDIIKSASISSDGNSLAIAYQNGKCLVIDPQDPDRKPIAFYNVKNSIASIYSYGRNEAYILTANAILLKWNYTNNKIIEIFHQNNMKTVDMAAINNKQLAICFSNGNIQYLNISTGTKDGDNLASHSKINKIVFDEKTKYIAIASSDNRISLINSKDINAKPFQIDDMCLHNFPIKEINFNSEGIVFVLTEENFIRYWNTDINHYANELNNMKISELSEKEINLIIGNNLY